MKSIIRSGISMLMLFAFAVFFSPNGTLAEEIWESDNNAGYMNWDMMADIPAPAQPSVYGEYAPQEIVYGEYAPKETVYGEYAPRTATTAYDVYDIYSMSPTASYSGYPYSYSGYPYSYGGYGGYGSSFNLGLFYSNVGTPTYVNPVVYSNPIVYSTPTVITQPVTYVAPVTYATPQYNVQAYVPPTYNYNYQTPSCSITASNSNANYNYYNYTNNNYYSGQTLLTWYSNGANSAYLSPSVGSVSTSGSTTVFPYGGNQLYTLTVSGPGGTATCQTTTYSNTYAYNYTAPQVYNNYVAPAPVYQAPTTPYVALTQIPYTGLDFGPVGNALYWLALALFAIAGGYLIVYYQGGGLSFLNGFLGADGPVPVRSAPRSEQVIEKAESAIPASRSNTPFGTKDSMKVEKSFNGEAPRIVIVRA